MALVVQIGLYILVGACFVAVLVFLGRAIVARVSISSESFNVARLQARRKMMQSALGAIAFLILGLILFVVVLLFPFGSVGSDDGEMVEEPAATQAVVEEPTPEGDSTEGGEDATPEPTETIELSTPIPTETAIPSVVPVTPTAPPTATVEPTPEPVQAIVNSPVVGLYVRETPGGEILERLEDQTAVSVLGDEQTVDEIVWVLVESPNGFVGWVAREFLLFEGAQP